MKLLCVESFPLNLGPNIQRVRLCWELGCSKDEMHGSCHISPIRKSRVCLDGKRGFGCCVSDFVWLDCLARFFQRCGHLEV